MRSVFKSGMPIFLMFIIAIAGCHSSESEENKTAKKAPPQVSVEPALRSSIGQFVETTGEIIATTTVTLRATVEGPISFCPFREGDRVEAGVKLLEVSRPLYRQEVEAQAAALAVARAKLADLKAGPRPEEIDEANQNYKERKDYEKFIKEDMERIAQLVESGGIPAEELDKARVAYFKANSDKKAARARLRALRAGPTPTQVAVQQALVRQEEARLETARAKLAECSVKAPFTGIVARVFVRPGDLAKPQAPLLEMYDPASLVVRFAVPEINASAVATGQKAGVNLDVYPGRAFSAVVSRIYPLLDQNTRTRMIEARITDRVSAVPGMFARVAVQVKSAADAIVIPDSAVLVMSNGEKVVFVVRQNQASRREVKTGIEQEQRVQILKGVEAGELVVVAGNEKLRDGVKVRMAETRQPALMKNGAGGQAK